MCCVYFSGRGLDISTESLRNVLSEVGTWSASMALNPWMPESPARDRKPGDFLVKG